MIKVLIASPGDTTKERSVLLNQLERTFRTNNHESRCGFRLAVEGWEDIASQKGYPQDVINEKLVKEVDFVIAVFRHKIGSPTIYPESKELRYGSGTIEELMSCFDNSDRQSPIPMCYFYGKPPRISLDSKDFDEIKVQWDKLKEFKNDIRSKMLYKQYSEANGLLTLICSDLEKNITDHFEN